MKQLTLTAQDDRAEFERIFGVGGNCSCHISPACNSCTHPGNPDNQAETEEAWEEVP